MDLAKLAGQHAFQLSDTSVNPPVVKTGCMTLKADGSGYAVLADYAVDQRPVQISGGIDLPGLQKDNVGRISFSFHQDQGRINGEFFFSTTGNSWYFQNPYGQGMATGTAQRVSS